MIYVDKRGLPATVRYQVILYAPINGRSVRIVRTVNHKNLRLVGIVIPSSVQINEQIAVELEKKMRDMIERNEHIGHPLFQPGESIGANEASRKDTSLTDVICRYLETRKNPSRQRLVLKDYFLKVVNNASKRSDN